MQAEERWEGRIQMCPVSLCCIELLGTRLWDSGDSLQSSGASVLTLCELEQICLKP